MLNEANFPQDPVTGKSLEHLSATARFVRDLQTGKKVTIVAMGTSLTGGGWRWADVMMTDWLDVDFPGQVRFFNEGVGASASSVGPEGDDRLSGLGKLQEVIAHKPDVVFIEFAVNDAYLPYKISLEDSKKNLNTMIDAILAANANAEVILQTTNCCIEEHAKLRPQLAAYMQGYRDVARSRGLTLVDNYPNWQRLLADDPVTFGKLVPDGIHPWPPGYQQIVLPQLKATLGGTKTPTKPL